MTKEILILLLILRINCQGQNSSQRVGAYIPSESPSAYEMDVNYNYRTNLNQFPFRKLGNKYCDLRPLFKWGSTPPAARSGYPNPMPAWKPIWCFVISRGVRSNGIVVEAKSRDAQPFFLLNYPIKTNAFDDAFIQGFAVEVGITNIDTNTIHVFDFGIPFDPKNQAKTNVIVATNVATLLK